MSAAQDNIEIVIRLPASSQVYKELADAIAKILSAQAPQVSEAKPKQEVKQQEVKQEVKAKQLSPEEQKQLQAKEKELQELQTLLEIAKARGQDDVVKETEAKIKEVQDAIAKIKG